MISRRVITASTMTAFLLATGCSQATAPANHASNTTNSTATHKTTNTTNNQTGNTQNSTANSAQPPKYNKADEKKAEAVAVAFTKAQASLSYKDLQSFENPKKYLYPDIKNPGIKILRQSKNRPCKTRTCLLLELPKPI